MRSHTVLTTIFLLIILAVVPMQSWAEDDTDDTAFSISPVPTENAATTDKGYFIYDVSTGASTSGSVLLKNPGTIPVTIHLAPVLGETAQTGGSAYSALEGLPQGAATWIALDQSSVTLEPGTQKTVSFMVNVPRSTRPGQYLAGIAAYVPSSVAQTPTISTTSARTQIGASITVQTRYVIGVQVNVPGGWTESVQVLSVNLGGRASNPYIGIRMRNNGDTFLKPHGLITLTDPNGKQALEKEIKMGTFVPGSEVIYPLRWSGELKEGSYKASIKLDYGSDKHATYEGTLDVSSQAITSGQSQPGTVSDGAISKATIGEHKPESKQAAQQPGGVGIGMWIGLALIVAALTLAIALALRSAGKRSRQAS